MSASEFWQIVGLIFILLHLASGRIEQISLGGPLDGFNLPTKREYQNGRGQVQLVFEDIDRINRVKAGMAKLLLNTTGGEELEELLEGSELCHESELRTNMRIFRMEMLPESALRTYVYGAMQHGMAGYKRTQ